MLTPEEKLAEMGITLPSESPTGVISATEDIEAHVEASIQQVKGSLVFTSQIPSVGTEGKFLGRLGENLTAEEGYQAARLCAINALGEMKVFLGDLSRIRQFIMMLGFVVCTPEFTQVPLVSNGATDLFAEVFGDRGKHARATMGIQSLAGGHSVEIVVWVDVE